MKAVAQDDPDLKEPINDNQEDLKKLVKLSAAAERDFARRYDAGDPKETPIAWEKPTGYQTLNHTAGSDELQDATERGKWASTMGDSFVDASHTHMAIRWPREFGAKLQIKLDLLRDVQGFADCVRRWITQDGKSVIIVFPRPRTVPGASMNDMMQLSADNLSYHVECIDAMVTALASIHVAGRSASGRYDPGNTLMLPQGFAFEAQILEPTSFCYQASQGNMDRDFVTLFAWYARSVDKLSAAFDDWTSFETLTEPEYRFDGDQWAKARDPFAESLKAEADALAALDDTKSPMLASQDVSSGDGYSDLDAKVPATSGWYKSHSGKPIKTVMRTRDIVWFRFRAARYHVPSLVKTGHAQRLGHWWYCLREELRKIHAKAQYVGPLHQNEFWVTMKGDLELVPRPTRRENAQNTRAIYQALDVIYAAHLFAQLLEEEA